MIRRTPFIGRAIAVDARKALVVGIALEKGSKTGPAFARHLAEHERVRFVFRIDFRQFAKPAERRVLTEPERRLFAGALTGTLRQGSLGGVMILALADRAGLAEAVVRRAVMVSGSITRAADALLGPDRRETPPASLELFQPIAPMLAGSAKDLHAALEEIDEPTARIVEWKLDGVRAQVHKIGDRIAVYSRSGHDVTEGCRPLLPALAAMGAERAVLDGEVVLEDETGAMRSFQDTFSAVAGGVIPAGDRLRIYFFDCMHEGGADLLDRPLSERLAILERIAPDELRVPRVSGASLEEARRFQTEAIAFGHEGVMVKDLRAPYRLGARGRAWQKVKEHTTVDLVILAVEPGSGRRQGFLARCWCLVFIKTTILPLVVIGLR